MEHKFYTDNFERLLKEQADEFRMYPSKRVWHSIYNDLHPDRKWPSIAVSIFLVTVLFLIGYWNNNTGSKSDTLLPATARNNGIASATTITAAPPDDITAFAYEPAGMQNSTMGDAAGNSTIHSSNAASAGNPVAPKAGSAYTMIPAGVTHQKNATTFKGSSTNNSATDKRSVAVSSKAGKTLPAHAGATAAGSGEIEVTVFAEEQETMLPSSTVTLNKEEEPYTEAGAEDEESVLLAALNTRSGEAGNTALPVTDYTAKPGLVVETNTQPSEGVKKALASAKQLTAEDKSWIDHYALYNKPVHKKWKGRLSSEMYITPGAGFVKMTPNTDYATANAFISPLSPAQPNNAVSFNPGLSFEAGAGLIYAVAKSIRIKAGIQANFSNYSMDVTDVNHPVLSTVMLNNLNTGNPYLESRRSSLANIPGLNNKKAHNQTSQISLPVGIAVKLAGNENIEWYVASTIQPTYVFSGKAYLVSSDHMNFIPDASMIRKWNLNTAAETYIHYKMNGFTLQAGPEFRYQLQSTYSKKYTYNENLFNLGLKVGIVKSL